MNTLTRPADNPAGPLSPPDTTPYFSRAARYREAFRLAAAGRGLPLPPWAA